MIAIIPARGGSNGLPRKNIKLLNGKPLIAYTIEAALKANCIDKVVVSTDDIEIAEISKKYGAEVPFMRPKDLAQDNSLAKDVYLYTMERLKDMYNCDVKEFMVLLPTAPLRDENDIDNAFSLFKKNKAKTLVSIKEAPCPPSWYFVKNDKNQIENAKLTSEEAVKNRQDNKVYYIPNGAIYILNYELLKNKGTYYCESTVGFLMNDEKSIDIDYELDFKFAEFLLKSKRKTV